MTNPNSESIIEFDALLVSLWKKKVRLALAVALGGLAALLYALLAAPVFRTEVTILPSGKADPFSSLRGFADIVGASIEPAGDLTPLYPEIVTSDQLLDPLIERRWFSPVDAESVTIAEFLRVRPTENLEALRGAVKKKLRRQVIRTLVDKSTGYTRLLVDLPRDPQLAAELANSMAYALNAFVVHYHKQRAREKREFIEAQLALVGADLAASEEALTQFLRNNRAFRESPDLQLEYQRLVREEELQNRLYAELKLQFESARIQEADQSRGLVLLDSAEPPTRRHSPRTGLLVAIGGLVGGMVFLVAVLSRDLLTWLRKTSDQDTA